MTHKKLHTATPPGIVQSPTHPPFGLQFMAWSPQIPDEVAAEQFQRQTSVAPQSIYQYKRITYAGPLPRERS